MRTTSGLPWRLAGALGALGAAALLAAHAHAQGAAAAPPPQLVWAPRPTVMTPYVAPNRPITKLADVLARHRGQASWRELIGKDPEIRAEYIQMAPGQKTQPQMLADQRLGIIVWDGQLRVSIEGQDRKSVV